MSCLARTVALPSLDDRSRSNARALARLYDAFVTGDLERAATFVARDNVHHVPGRGPNANEYWGPEGFARFMTNIRRYNGGVFSLSVPVFSVSGDDAFTREIIRINRAHDPDRIWTLRISNRFRMRDGQIAESWVIPENQREYDDYWSKASPSENNPPRVTQELSPFEGLDEKRAVSVETTALLREMYRRFWNGETEGLRTLFAEDVVVDIVGQSGISGVYHGWEGFLAFRERLMSLSGDKYKLDVVAMAGSEGDVWATEYIRMNRYWDPTVAGLWVQMHFEIQNARIVRMNDFPFDTYAWESFFTSPLRHAAAADDTIVR